MSTTTPVSSPLNQLEAILECVVCLETFTDPRVLPCQHTICLPCLEAISQKVRPTRAVPSSQLLGVSQSEFQCPSCRKSYSLPPGGAEAFPKNLLAISLLDTMMSSSHVEASGQCMTQSVDTKTSPAGVALHSVDSSVGQGMEECRQHPRHAVKYFCNRCEVAVCSECCMESHSGHVTCRLDTIAGKMKAQVEWNMVCAAEEMSRLRAARADIEMKKAELEHNLRMAKKEVSLTAETLCQRARQQEAELLTNIDQIGFSALEKMQESLSDCDHQMASAERLCSNMESLQTDQEIVVEGLSMARALGGLTSLSIPAVRCDVNIRKDAEPTQVSPASLVGRVDVLVKDAKTLAGGNIIESFPSSSESLAEVGCALGRPLTQFALTYKLSVTGMVLLQGHICVTHFRNPYLWLYRNDGTLEAKVKVPKMLAPCGLALQDATKRTLVITDAATVTSNVKPPCRLHLVTLGKDHTLAHHKLQKLDYIPRRVSAYENGDLVIGVVNDNRCVIHDVAGDLKWKVAFPDEIRAPVLIRKNPRVGYIVLEPNKVTWLDNSCHIQRFCSTPDISCTTDFVEGDNGDLLVLDQGYHKLHRIGRDGRYRTCLLEEPCTVKKPLCLCLDRSSQKLYVAHQTKAGPRLIEYCTSGLGAERDVEGTHFSIDLKLWTWKWHSLKKILMYIQRVQQLCSALEFSVHKL